MQERIKNIEEYFVAFNIAENMAYIQVQFPEKWDVPSNEILEENFNVRTAPESNGSMYFFSELSNGILNVFDAVDFAIEYNKDLEEKGELFRVKIEELKELFATKTLEELRNMKIVIETPQALPWKKNKNEEKRDKTRGNKGKKSSRAEKKEKKSEIVEEVKDDETNVNNNVEIGEPDVMQNSLLSFAENLVKEEA